MVVYNRTRLTDRVALKNTVRMNCIFYLVVSDQTDTEAVFL